jgi:hypothetical protein
MQRKNMMERRTGSGLFDSATQQVLVKLAQKILPPGESDDQLINESGIASSVNGISHIGIYQDFQKSDSVDEVSLVKELGRILQGTDKVCDFIDDKNTMLIHKDTVYPLKPEGMNNKRFIIYQKEESVGQLKLRIPQSQSPDEFQEEDEPILISNCTFYFCQTHPSEPDKLFPGIEIGTSKKIHFLDCAFIGKNFTSYKLPTADFKALTDCYMKVSIEFSHCYFRDLRTIFVSNFQLNSLILRSCTFLDIENECIMATHPSEMKIEDCKFTNCSGYSINVRLFDEDGANTTEKMKNKTSSFATQTRMFVNSLSVMKSEHRMNYSIAEHDKSRFTRILDIRKKKIKISNNIFSSCQSCIKLKCTKKTGACVDSMDITINDNSFDSCRGRAIGLENLNPGRMQVINNTVSKCNSSGFRFLNCRASKNEFVIGHNVLAGVFNVAVWVENSILTMLDNRISSCTNGLYLSLTSNHGRDEADSQKEIMLRETVRDSFIGHSINTQGMGGGMISGTTVVPFDGFMPCMISPRVIIKGDQYKEISQCGILLQNNMGSSVKIELCEFSNVREPILINEKEYLVSRIATKNNIQQDLSDIMAPSLTQMTPRSNILTRGTIVIKKNTFSGSSNNVIIRRLTSYLYQMANKITEGKGSSRHPNHRMTNEL